MEDKVFIKNGKEKFGDKHPHWMLVIYSLIYVGCVIISLFVIDKSIIPFLLVLSVGSLIMIYYIVKKISWDKAAGLVGFIMRDGVLYAIRLYGDYSQAGVYIPIPPSMTSLFAATMPNNIDYVKNSLAIERNVNELSKNKNVYSLILENLLSDIKNNKGRFWENPSDYKTDMFINKYGFKRYMPNLADGFYCGYIIMNNPKIVKYNKRWFEISFIDENNNSKIMRFKNVYGNLLDEIKKSY